MFAQSHPLNPLAPVRTARRETPEPTIELDEPATKLYRLIKESGGISADQLQVIADTIRAEAPARHGVDLRASLPLLGKKRVCFRLLFGTERRNLDRLRLEGQLDIRRIAVVEAGIIFALLGYALFGLVCFLYLVKSALKIDLMAGPSPFHDLYRLFLA